MIVPSPRKYWITNPAREAWTIEASRPLHACIVALVIGEGHYGVNERDRVIGDESAVVMPPFFLSKRAGLDVWWASNRPRGASRDVFEWLQSEQAMDEYEGIAQAAESIECEGPRRNLAVDVAADGERLAAELRFKLTIRHE